MPTGRFVSRVLLCVGIGFVVSAAAAQMSEADIAALRAQGEAEGWTFEVGLNEATEYGLDELCGAVEAPGWRETARFDPCLPQRDLPTYWDWTWGGCTAIRNQGGCGSCWAFGALGAVESFIRITQLETTDLSEQWLVSCTDAGSCGGGWHTLSFDYLSCGGAQDPCGDAGAVWEADFPYVAYDAECACPYDEREYCLDGWAAVGYVWDIPSVAQIKQAIVNHGPVATCVYVNDAFQAYSGGVFNACEDEWINHVVVLVGWDDNRGENGAWRMRNSWGPGWGEAGYMWIEYECCRIGYATCYVSVDMEDCDGNGVHDAIDLRVGNAEDCNDNDVPDSCDIASGYSEDVDGNGVPDECEAQGLVGDLNCDGVVSFDDIAAFVRALGGQEVYEGAYPACRWLNADCDGDGDVDFDDVAPFVALF